MNLRNRRDFLADVGKGMLVASVGTGLAADLGLSTALAEPRVKALEFGRLEPLVELMQENSADRMLPLVIERLAQGAELRDMVAAAALANARTFGGEDYVGFHAFMALAPAFDMSKELPEDRRSLPILKVLYRSTNQIQTKGGRAAEVLHPVEPAHLLATEKPRETLRDAMRRRDKDQAETVLAAIAARSHAQAFNDVQALVQDDADVHRVVLAYRAWDLLGLIGKEHALTTLRQSVRYCVDSEKFRVSHGMAEPGIRAVLPNLLDHYKLSGKTAGAREADDGWSLQFCNTLLAANPAQGAEAVAGALAEGYSAASIGEALSMCATQQVLRDPGRTVAQPGKPLGSVHGDSPGVHASDSMNAWRNMAKVSDHANLITALIVAGYHVAMPTGRDWKALPSEGDAARIVVQDPTLLLQEVDAAIRNNDQARASSLTKRYGEMGHASRPFFDLMLNYAVSEDGALHAEKYYHTVNEEFGRTRKAYRWDHAVALARVTASEYGKRAAGYEQACDLLKVRS